MEVVILQHPWTERYFGPEPAWIKKNSAMVVFRRAMRLLITEDDGIQWLLEIPEGYISDRASIPRLAYWFAVPSGDLELASYPHDLGYSHGGKAFGKSKDWWDELFRATLEATPKVIPRWKRLGSYLAVRVGGRGGWSNGWAAWPETWGRGMYRKNLVNSDS